MAKINMQDLNTFAEERGITVRYLKQNHSDLFIREGRVVSIKVDEYDNRLAETQPKPKKKQKKRVFKPQTLLKREMSKIRGYDDFIISSGIEIDQKQVERSTLDDPLDIALHDLEIEELQNRISEKENLKRKAELKIKHIIPSKSLKDSSKS